MDAGSSPPLNKQIFTVLVVVFLSSVSLERVSYQLWTYDLLCDAEALMPWLTCC